MATNEYRVERRATTKAAPPAVFALIIDFHHLSRWSPWEDLDPAMRRTFSGAASGVGAVYEWSGNRKAGEGRMEVVEAEAPFRVVVDLQFIKPFKSHSTTTFELTEISDGTLVVWRMVGRKTLATKVMGLFKSMDEMIGPDFEKGLARLTAAAES
jgi:uncharacterized protein YndB with AHSA1/START domain